MENQMWDQQTDDKIFMLREEGLTFSQIAALLNRTKNAVIGRYGRQKKLRSSPEIQAKPYKSFALTQSEVNRIFELRKTGLGTTAIAKEIGRSSRIVLKYIMRQANEFSARDKVVNLVPSKEYKSPKRETYQSFAASGGVTLMELTPHTCRWPVGDPRHDDFRFCGDYAEPGKVYCCQHHALAYYRTTPISNSRIKEMQRV